MHFSQKTVIHSPIDDVFRLVVDLEHAPHVHPIVKNTVQLTSGEVGLGTRWRKDYAWFGTKGSFELEVDEWEPPYKIVFKGTPFGTIVPYFAIHFREVEAGTEMKYVIEPMIGNGLMAVMFRVFAPIVGKRDLGNYFKKLKLILEV